MQGMDMDMEVVLVTMGMAMAIMVMDTVIMGEDTAGTTTVIIP